MKQINDDNIDEIMFQLLEGEITGAEREQLLNAIESDEEYSKLWMAWQHTVLSPGTEQESMDIKVLKKRAGRIIPFNYKYAIAAMLILGLGLAVLLTRQNPGEPVVADKPQPPINTKVQDIKGPKPEVKTLIETRDTVVPLKEKIRMMAQGRSNSRNLEEVRPVESSGKEVEKPVIKEPVNIAQAKEENKPVIPQKPAVQQDDNDDDHIIVSISSDSKPAYTKAAPSDQVEGPKRTLLSRIFGKPRIKLENDSSTRTNKRLIIENKQYKIIAGF